MKKTHKTGRAAAALAALAALAAVAVCAALSSIAFAQSSAVGGGGCIAAHDPAGRQR